MKAGIVTYINGTIVSSIREKYLKGLSELHEKNCIWKYSECDDWIYSFPFFTSYDAIKKWQDQVYTLITKNESLPLVTSPLVFSSLFTYFSDVWRALTLLDT